MVFVGNKKEMLMKKNFIIPVVLMIVAAAQAGLVDWTSDLYFSAPATGVANGTLVGLYQDVNGDNTLTWNTALSQMFVNTDGAVVGGLNGMDNDIFLGFSTMVVPFGTTLSLNSQSLNLDNNIQIYTVLFNATSLTVASFGAVDDAATFNSGSVVAPDQPLGYNIGSNVANGAMGGVSVIPEPATFLLFGMGGVGAWLVRRNKLKAKEEA